MRYIYFAAAVIISCPSCVPSHAATMVFFDPSQIATSAGSGSTWDQVRSNGYLFTYTRDKLFTGGGPVPIGRPVSVSWPQGVQAQAVTAGPSPSKAKITIERADGDVFDLTAFTARLLANTAGAGGAFEVVPFLNGQEMLPDPVTFDATGYYGSTFHYDQSPNPWGSTARLTGYDKYTMDLYVDFAWTALSLEGAPVPLPPGDYNENGVVDAGDYVVWRKNAWTTTEYDVWRSSFGQAAGTGMADIGSAKDPIPEPSAVALVCFAAASLQRQIRKARART